jgi:hypothetical protein
VAAVKTNFHRPEDHWIFTNNQKTLSLAKCALVTKILNGTQNGAKEIFTLQIFGNL